MNQRLKNGEHYRLPDGQEFHLCGQAGMQQSGRVLVNGVLVAMSLDANKLQSCPRIPYRQRSFSYDSRTNRGLIWLTMKIVECR
jgi:hypothetical protein